MSVTACFRDPFTVWVQEHEPSYYSKIYQPGGYLGAPAVGWELIVGRTRFVYRVPAEQQDVLYIVLIERAGTRQALHSPFVDFVRLLQLIQRSGAGIRWIRGHVEPSGDRPEDALGKERILAFYRRYLTAVSDGVDNGVQWYGGDLTTFSWSAEKRKVRHRHEDADSAGSPPGPHLNR